MLACESDDREGLDGRHTDEADVYRLAAAGDHDAQVSMASLCLAKGIDGRVSPSDATLMALVWANMASTSGKAPHALAYAGVIMVQASQAMANGMPEASCENLFAEALAIIDKVADAGHARADLVSLALAQHMTPDGIAKAQLLRACIYIEPLTADEREEDAAGLDWIVAVLSQQTEQEG